MREIFLGKPWHWALVVVATAVLWWAGASKAHVIHFNMFLVTLAIGSFALILLILKTHKPGEQVTRNAQRAPLAFPCNADSQLSFHLPREQYAVGTIQAHRPLGARASGAEQITSD